MPADACPALCTQSFQDWDLVSNSSFSERSAEVAAAKLCIWAIATNDAKTVASGLLKPVRRVNSFICNMNFLIFGIQYAIKDELDFANGEFTLPLVTVLLVKATTRLKALREAG